jgi:mRNA interferase MazF
LPQYVAGQIVLADWRDALPKEPNKLRPAIVVEDSELFGPSYPNVILVPISEDGDFAAPDLSLVIDPTPENGCTKRSYALSHCVTTNSKQRVRPTQSRILPEQLQTIRRQIVLAIGLEIEGSTLG